MAISARPWKKSNRKTESKMGTYAEVAPTLPAVYTVRETFLACPRESYARLKVFRPGDIVTVYQVVRNRTLGGYTAWSLIGRPRFKFTGEPTYRLPLSILEREV